MTKKIYYVKNLLNEGLPNIGPFNTHDRAEAFIKKHHFFGTIHEKEIEVKIKRKEKKMKKKPFSEFYKIDPEMLADWFEDTMKEYKNCPFHEHLQQVYDALNGEMIGVDSLAEYSYKNGWG